MSIQTNPSAEVNGCPAAQAGQPLASGYPPQSSTDHPSRPQNGSIHMLQSLEAEAAVIECLLSDETASFAAIDQYGIGSRHFRHADYKKLFKVAVGLHQAGHPVSVQTLFTEARQAGVDPLLLAAVESHAHDPRHIRVSDVPFHLERLKELQIRRGVFDLGQRAQAIALDATTPVHNLLVDAYDHFGRMVHQTDPEPLTICSAQELTAVSIREDDNLLGDRLLAKGQSLTITGAGGVGKSRLLLQLAACCITGRPFLGLPTYGRDTTWLILQAENSPRRLQQDLQSLRRWLGEDDWQKVSQRLYCHTLVKTSDQFMQVDDPLGLSRMRAWIDRLQPDVVCFDPLNCFVTGDLNSDRDMRQFCTEATRLCLTGNPDRALVVLHHARTGKQGAAQATGYDRSGFARNSKVLYNWTRGQMNIAPRSAEDNQQLVVACGKCSNGREFKPFGITLNPEAMVYHLDPRFNLAEWEDRMQHSTPSAGDPVDALLEICTVPCSRLEARQQMEQRGFSKAGSYKAIARALDEKLIFWQGDLLTLADAPCEEQAA